MRSLTLTLMLAVTPLALGGCCTEVGCLSAVTFELGTAADQFVPDEPVEVRACLASECVVDTLTLGAGASEASNVTSTLRFSAASRVLLFTPATGGGPGLHAVSLELSRQGRVVLSVVRPSLEFLRVTPNGPFCGPTCWSATVGP